MCGRNSDVYSWFTIFLDKWYSSQTLKDHYYVVTTDMTCVHTHITKDKANGCSRRLRSEGPRTHAGTESVADLIYSWSWSAWSSLRLMAARTLYDSPHLQRQRAIMGWTRLSVCTWFTSLKELYSAAYL